MIQCKANLWMVLYCIFNHSNELVVLLDLNNKYPIYYESTFETMLAKPSNPTAIRLMKKGPIR